MIFHLHLLVVQRLFKTDFQEAVPIRTHPEQPHAKAENMVFLLRSNSIGCAESSGLQLWFSSLPTSAWLWQNECPLHSWLRGRRGGDSALTGISYEALAP